MRIAALLTAIVVLASGLLVRSATNGAFAKYAGVALYAALIYALLVFIAPRWSPVKVAVIALAVCWVVEFAQLTPVPAELSARSTLARLALGSTFNAPDLFWYAVGTTVLFCLHRMVSAQSARQVL